MTLAPAAIFKIPTESPQPAPGLPASRRADREMVRAAPRLI
jgi:hypothetical protein